jgi:hypothetical protein
MPVSTIQNASLASGVPSTAKLPAGTVLQVVNFSTNTETNATTSTYIDTAITATITPTSATSKILVLVSANGLVKFNANTSGNLRILRGATSILIFGGVFGFTGSTAGNAVGGASAEYLDSPATTSATTYKVQIVNNGNSGEVRVNWDTNANSTITLMEIAQ